LRHKAARGELRQFLPVGFDYDETGAVVLSPDEAVVEAIATVFRRFAELGTGRQVLLSLRGDGLLIPRRPTRTGRVHWAPATYPAVHDFLTNPVYAGAFMFGRTRTEKRIDATGKDVARTVLLPRDQWEVLIPDHHQGFIDWATFEANTARLRANSRAPRGSGGGAPREGAALLQGRLRCGKCSRLMQTGYSGTKGDWRVGSIGLGGLRLRQTLRQHPSADLRHCCISLRTLLPSHSTDYPPRSFRERPRAGRHIQVLSFSMMTTHTEALPLSMNVHRRPGSGKLASETRRQVIPWLGRL
jgi:hypothetical protein